MLPRIITRGDHEAARLLAREGIRQLNILKNLMSFGNLKQDVRRVRFINGSEIVCKSVFGTDEVQIYVPEKERGKKKIPLGRFFAKVRRGGLYGKITYYWLTFTRLKGELIVSARKVKNSDININGISIKETLWAFSNLPLHMNHAATKSFMLNKAEEGKEPNYQRWVATQHALAIDTTLVFYPLYYAVPPRSFNFIYPYPTELGGDRLGGFTHPAPPNRFYCDVNKGLMAWYSTKTVDNPENIEWPPINLVFGILLWIDKGLITGVKTFECKSNEAGCTGFEALRSLRESDLGNPTTENPLPLWPEVPIDMMSEVNSISLTELEVVIPWNYRPIMIKIDLTKAELRSQEKDHTYKAINSCNHWYWTKKGFEQKLFASFNQIDKSDAPDDYVEDSGSGGGVDCSCGDIDACNSAIGNKSWDKNQRINYSSTDINSSIEIHIFNLTQKASSIIMLGRAINGHRGYEWVSCEWEGYPEPGHCQGTSTSNYDEQERYIEETTRQKKVDSLEAEWSSPNIAFIGSEIRRRRAKNIALQRPTLSGFCWSGGSSEDFTPCFNRDEKHGHPASDFSGGVCFYPYSFPNVEWADDVGIGESFYQISDGYEWDISQNADEYSKTPIVEFNVEGEESFSLSKYNRTYYLDDRSSENSEGLLVAARGAVIADLTKFWQYPIFDVAQWDITYKFPDEDTFINVTAKVLNALGCDKTELIELGLI